MEKVTKEVSSLNSDETKQLLADYAATEKRARRAEIIAILALLIALSTPVIQRIIKEIIKD